MPNVSEQITNSAVSLGHMLHQEICRKYDVIIQMHASWDQFLARCMQQ